MDQSASKRGDYVKMASQGSTYGQALPEGVAKHRKLLAEEAEAARERRRKKGRGNGKRYKFDGKKGQVQQAHDLLAGERDALREQGLLR